jgi:hypothetical protein
MHPLSGGFSADSEISSLHPTFGPRRGNRCFCEKSWKWKRKLRSPGEVTFITSGNARQMKKAARLAFHVKIQKIYSNDELKLN